MYFLMTSFFFNDTATTEIYTLSLHDALPIYEDGEDSDRAEGRAEVRVAEHVGVVLEADELADGDGVAGLRDRKSTRLNSSHANISYAVFCLKKQKLEKTPQSKLRTHPK